MTQAIESIGGPNALFVYNTRARGQVNSHAMAPSKGGVSSMCGLHRARRVTFGYQLGVGGH